MSFALAGIAFFLAAAGAEPPCRAAETGKSLDFWLGEWTVVSQDGATPYGDNSITMAMDGCIILERWRSAAGFEGFSLFAFDARTQAWEQTWVTADTSKAGGLKRKKRIDADSGMAVFQGAIVSESGAPYLDRTTLTALDDGRVRQLIEISTDDGESWRAVFDGYYARTKKKAP